MAEVQNFAEITPSLPFSEFNFYDVFRSSFERSKLGMMKNLLPLHEMAENFGLISRSLRPMRGKLVKNAEGTLRSEACQGQDKDDGDSVYLLRYTHGERGATGRQERDAGTVGGCMRRKKRPKQPE